MDGSSTSDTTGSAALLTSGKPAFESDGSSTSPKPRAAWVAGKFAKLLPRPGEGKPTSAAGRLGRTLTEGKSAAGRTLPPILGKSSSMLAGEGARAAFAVARGGAALRAAGEGKSKSKSSGAGAAEIAAGAGGAGIGRSSNARGATGAGKSSNGGGASAAGKSASGSLAIGARGGFGALAAVGGRPAAGRSKSLNAPGADTSGALGAAAGARRAGIGGGLPIVGAAGATPSIVPFKLASRRGGTWIGAGPGAAVPAAGATPTIVPLRFGCGAPAAGATPTIVPFRSARGAGAESAGGGADSPKSTPSAPPSTGLGPVLRASPGGSTLKDVPHLGQRILRPLEGMRRSSTWYGALQPGHSTLNITDALS